MGVLGEKSFDLIILEKKFVDLSILGNKSSEMGVSDF